MQSRESAYILLFFFALEIRFVWKSTPIYLKWRHSTRKEARGELQDGNRRDLVGGDAVFNTLRGKSGGELDLASSIKAMHR